MIKYNYQNLTEHRRLILIYNILCILFYHYRIQAKDNYISLYRITFE